MSPRTNNEHKNDCAASRLRHAAILRLAEGIVITRVALDAARIAARDGARDEARDAGKFGHGLAAGAQGWPDEACDISGMPAAALSSVRSRNRGPAHVARARQRAMYLAHVAGGLSLTSVGLGFGRDRTTVRHACAIWEDARDDSRVDLALSCEEAGLQAMGAMLGLGPASAASALAE